MSQPDREKAPDGYDDAVTGAGVTWTIASTAASQAAWTFEEGIVNPELPRLTCEELKQLTDQGHDLVVVDAGIESHFRRGHIKGAVHIPADPLPPFTEEFTMAKLDMLPHEAMIVFYCDWEDDSESASLALKLLESGFDTQKVKVLSKGWNRWLELGYPIEK